MTSTTTGNGTTAAAVTPVSEERVLVERGARTRVSRLLVTSIVVAPIRLA